jgi:hypothetical protein
VVPRHRCTPPASGSEAPRNDSFDWYDIRLSAMALVDLHSDRLPARFASFVARQQAPAFYRTRRRAPAVGEAARPS